MTNNTKKSYREQVIERFAAELETTEAWLQNKSWSVVRDFAFSYGIRRQIVTALRKTPDLLPERTAREILQHGVTLADVNFEWVELNCPTDYDDVHTAIAGAVDTAQSYDED